MLTVPLTNEDCDKDGFPIVRKVAEAIMRSMGIKRWVRDGIKRWPPLVEREVWGKIRDGVVSGILHPLAPNGDPKGKHTNRDRNDIVDALVPLNQLQDWGQRIGLYAFEVKPSASADNKSVRRRGRKPGPQRELLQKILSALETWAKECDETFDSMKMPGQVGSATEDGSFHWLCAKLYPTEFTKGEKAFKGYRAGLCTFPPYPKKSDFYCRAIDRIAQTLGVNVNATKNKLAAQKGS